MSTVEVPNFVAGTIGIIVFFLGAFLTRKIALLRDYNIPEPVSGGLVAALVTWVIYVVFDLEVVFDLSTRDVLLVYFFTTIGLEARFADLVRGGKALFLLLGLTVAYMTFQNVVALVGVSVFDLPRSVSVLLGTASLIGGHGTAIAWGPTVGETSGFEAAAEIGIAAATLGLIFASLIGGPIAKFLMERKGLTPDAGDDHIVGLPFESDNKYEGKLDHIDLMRSILTINVAILLGWFAHQGITAMGLKLPLFVPCLLMGIVLSNTVPYAVPKLTWPARTRAMAVISDYCLMIFLAMSLMSMKLWTMAGLGLPLLTVLAMQVIATVVFIVFLLFRVMGSDYTAAVLSAGFAGFSLGATPTAIANMSSVTKRYGPAPMAFILLPLVSAFFVDLFNAFLIQFFVSL
ncbi:MAG: sodium/glutamate symporter [Planctomycetota bacterium]